MMDQEPAGWIPDDGSGACRMDFREGSQGKVTTGLAFAASGYTERNSAMTWRSSAEQASAAEPAAGRRYRYE